jgi:hypothetical protein
MQLSCANNYMFSAVQYKLRTQSPLFSYFHMLNIKNELLIRC